MCTWKTKGWEKVFSDVALNKPLQVYAHLYEPINKKIRKKIQVFDQHYYLVFSYIRESPPVA